jgi:hypothetical protein
MDELLDMKIKAILQKEMAATRSEYDGEFVLLRKENEQLRNELESIQKRDEESNKWMNKKEACKFMHVCNNTLSKYIDDYRDFPVYTVGERYFFSPSELSDFIKNPGRYE